MYSVKRSEMTITLVNGSRLLMRSRHVDNPSRGRDVARGLDVSFVIDDEAAEGFDLQAYTNISACCRRASKHRFYACCTTPRLNEYHDLATSSGHQVIYSSSRDNPHLPDGWVDELASQMSQKQAEREIDGRWVDLEGLVWDAWSMEKWPNGNIHPCRFDRSKPWYLFLDLGVGNGAYIVVQRHKAELYGNEIFRGNVWVAVAQVTPVHDGSASRAFQILYQNFGNPVHVVAGADVHTRANTDAKTVAYFAEQIFGAVPITPITGWLADKQIQYDRMSYLISSVTGERRFCASEHLVTLGCDERHMRGVLELMKQDTWPENAGKVRGVFLSKEGRLEHIRDALLYGAVGLMHPPNFGKTGQLAA
jgi:hypothetical protein